MATVRNCQHVLTVGPLAVALAVSIAAIADTSTLITLTRQPVETSGQREQSIAWLAKVTDAARYFRGLEGSVAASLAPRADLLCLGHAPAGTVMRALVLGPIQPIPIREHLTDLPPPTRLG